MSDGKCPKCGRYLIPDGEDGFCRCGYDPSCRFMDPELALTAAMHRIRELEAIARDLKMNCRDYFDESERYRSALKDIDTISRGSRTVAEQHEEIVDIAREALQK